MSDDSNSALREELEKPEINANEVPSALLLIADRAYTLSQVIEVFRGWDSDIADLKSSAISELAEVKKSISEIKLLNQRLQEEYQGFEEEKERARILKYKYDFIINNIPDRFNCPSNISLPSAEPVNTESKPVSTNATAPAPKPSNVPEILFLTIDEFEKVPKYLKGRATYDKINAFIDVVNKVISQKYAIFKRKRSTLKKRDADLWNEFNIQELKETKGLYFCVANDFKTFTGCVLDKVSLNMLTVLRHCGRIRELRTRGILRYVVNF